MYRPSLRLLPLVFSLVASCAGDGELETTSADAGAPPSRPSGPWPAHCDVPADAYLPPALECTGLYAGGLVDKQIASGVREFTPAAALWSDAAEKRRFIWLPPGTTIDASNPNEWVFPVGTKTWKEFRLAGRRVETRFFYKESADSWKRATYVWRDGETSATIWEDATDVSNLVPLAGGGDYLLPTRLECNDCHKGRKDKVLGFEQLLLGMAGARGYTLRELVAEGRLAPPPAIASHEIPDDGTGLASEALAYMHVNCGVSCHNESSTSLAYPTELFLRLDPSRLAGPRTEWNPLKTTLNVPAHVSNFAGEIRLVPGSPATSLILKLSGTRGTNAQMPPFGSRVVDQRGVALMTQWIGRLAPDASVPVTPAPHEAEVPVL